MKSYAITVNGKTYDVVVEEKDAAGAVAPAAPTPAVAAAPAAAPAPAPAPAPAAGGAGSIEIKAGAAGKVFKMTASVGQQVNAGDEIVVMEIMKMETPVVAPEAGTIVSINVTEGQMLESGALIATMN